jgi:hypothetical protein
MEGLVSCDVLFSDYVRIWLEQITRTVDEVTLQGYKVLADGHILPYFDERKTPLVKVDHKVIQRYIDSKHQNGRLDGKGGGTVPGGHVPAEGQLQYRQADDQLGHL